MCVHIYVCVYREREKERERRRKREKGNNLINQMGPNINKRAIGIPCTILTLVHMKVFPNKKKICNAGWVSFSVQIPWHMIYSKYSIKSNPLKIWAHIYNGMLLSHKKERNNNICSNMDKPRDYQIK